MRHDDQVADGMDTLAPGNPKRRVDLQGQLDRVIGETGRGERGASRRREDEIGAEFAEIAVDGYALAVAPELGDGDAAGEPVAALVVDDPRRLREARALVTE